MSVQVEMILRAAKTDCRKGYYPVYIMYKRKLEDLCISNEEYGEACRKLATMLRV